MVLYHIKRFRVIVWFWIGYEKGLCDFVSPANNRWSRKNSQSPFMSDCVKTTMFTLTLCHACSQIIEKNNRIVARADSVSRIVSV